MAVAALASANWWPFAPALEVEGAIPVDARTTSSVGSTRGLVGLAAGDLADQGLDGLHAGVGRALGEGGEGRVAEVGAEDVVEADDADVVGDPDAALA